MLRPFLLVLTGLLLLPPLSATAQPDSLDRAFRAGNDAYQAGRYAESIEAYQSVLAAGYASAELYYNLGNAYFRAGEIGQAIRYYEKARRLRPGDPRLQHNLEQARERARVTSAGDSAPGWRRWVARWSPVAVWAGALALLASGGAVAVVRSGRARSASPWRHPAVGGLIAAGLLMGAGAMALSYMQDTTRRAVVVAREAPVRLDPQRTAVDTAVPEGTLLHLDRSSRPDTSESASPWIRVRLPDGSTGWVPADSLGRID